MGQRSVVVQDERRRAGLARDDDRLQGREIGQRRLPQQEGVERRQAERVADRVLPDQRHEAPQVLLLVAARDDERAAGGQRPEDAGDRAVEREGRLEQEAGWCRAIDAKTGLGRVHQIAVRDRHALGAAGGTRRVEDIGQIVGLRAGLRLRRRGLRRLQIERHDPRPGIGETIEQRRLGHHDDGCAGVIQHLAHQARRIGRVERHIGAPGLQDAEQAHDHLGRRLGDDRHGLAAGDARRTQLCGKRPGVGVELGIGERPVGPDHGESVAVSLGRPRDPVMHAAELDRTGRRVVPSQQLLAIGLVGEANVPEQRSGCTGELGQDSVEQLQAKPRHGRVDPARIVNGQEPEPGAGDAEQGQGVVALLVEAELAHLEPRVRRQQGTAVGVVLEDQDALEQSLAGRHLAPALHRGERAELEASCLDLALLDGLEPGGERGGRVDGDAQRQRVDEEADRPLDARQLRRSSGCRDAEDDVVLAGQPAQEQRPGTLEDGVEGQAVRRGNGAKGARRLGREISFLLTDARCRRAIRLASATPAASAR